MLSNRPIIGAVACSALLWAGLGLSNLALSSEMASGKNERQRIRQDH